MDSERTQTRSRIITAATELLNGGGRDAVTTRSVAEAAGVQAPAIYRLFTDKNGLLEAVAEHGITSYLQKKKARKSSGDPLADLRSGWNLHIEFGLANPAIYKLIYCDPSASPKAPAAAASYAVLQSHVGRLAAAGLLRVSPQRAADLMHSSACGIILTLLGQNPEARDLEISTLAREAVLAAITHSPTNPSDGGLVAAANSVAASLDQDDNLSAAERALMAEWLRRLIAGR